MRWRRRLNRLLNCLGRHGVLSMVDIDMRTGTRIWVETGTRIRAMNPGTAKAHLRALERGEWWC